jgi:hypothetical protein
MKSPAKMTPAELDRLRAIIARQAQEPATIATSATVRVRLKGQADGPVFNGQTLVRGCRSCG